MFVAPPRRFRRGRLWAVLLLPMLMFACALAARFWLLPLADRLATGAAPLEGLDQAEIPSEERRSWQPRELVGVFGTQPGRHWGTITCAVFSPDGKWVATGGEDRLVTVWNMATLTPTAVLEGQWDRVHLLAFAPDGKTLAVVSSGAVHLWHLEADRPRELGQLNEAASLRALVFSADGKRLAWGRQDGTFRVWDLDGATPADHANFQQEGDVWGLALSPDGSALAACQGERGEVVRVWDVKVASDRPKVKHTLKDVGPVQAIAFAPDLKSFVAVGEDGLVKLWDVAAAKVRGDCEQTGPHLSFAADGKGLATCSTGGTVRLWDLESGKPALRSTLALKLADPIEWLVFSPDHKTVLVAAGSVVRVFELSSGLAQLRSTLQGRLRAVTALAFSPDGKTLAAGSSFPKGPGGEANEADCVQLWDLSGKQPKERLRLGGHKKEVMWLTFAPNGRMLASGSDDSVRLWDTSGQVKERANLQGSSGPIAFSPNSKTLATALGGTMQLWSASGDQLADWAKYTDPKVPGCRVTALAFSPDGNALATGTRAMTVDLWALGGPMPGERITLEGHQIGVALAYAPDGKMLLTSGMDGTLRVWDVVSNPPKLRITVEGIGNNGGTGADPVIAFAPNGKLVALVGADNSVMVWNVANGKKVYDWHVHGDVRSLAFAPDSRHLATGNGNGTVYILRLAQQGSVGVQGTIREGTMRGP